MGVAQAGDKASESNITVAELVLKAQKKFLRAIAVIRRFCFVLVANNLHVTAGVRYTWFSRDITKILKSKPGGLHKFYLHLRIDYLKIYSCTIP